MKAKTIVPRALDYSRFAVLASVCLAGIPSGIPRPIQEDITTLRTNEEPVQVEVVVLGNQGKPVAGETVDSSSGRSVSREADFLLGASGREPADQPETQKDAPEKTPRSTTAASPGPAEWAPGDIDRTAVLVKTGIACSLTDVLSGAGQQIEELVKNVGRFTATEVVEHQDVDRRGILQAPVIHTFDYLVSIREAYHGLMSVEEYRNGDFSPNQLPGGLASHGYPSLVMIFHPRYAPDFDMNCEGLGEWQGQPAWLVRFEQRKDRPNNMHTFSVGQRRYDLRLRGRAWIKSDTYEILRLDTDLLEPIPSIRLLLEHVKIEYQPVRFQDRNVQLWLPKSAELYLEYRGHRFRREHHFTNFKLFSVETNDEITPPIARDPRR